MPRAESLTSLRRSAPHVLPSMLLCDFANLRHEIEAIEAAGVKALHLDVMDGHFVPNLTYGMPLVAAMRAVTDLPLDVHLMISNPADYIVRYAEAGADIITVHVEAIDAPEPVLAQIREVGCAAGLALNPPTPVSAVTPHLDHCDLILVMSVMPGFGGQAFDERALDKLRQLRACAGDRIALEVDGGVNADTIAVCAEAGADLLVAGSAIFNHEDYSHSVTKLDQLARASHGDGSE